MKIPRVTLIIPIALSSVISSSGCTSMSSTFMQRQEDDQLLGISNGKLGTHNHARPFKGIPVTLKVPTHLDLSIVETLLVVDKQSRYEVTELASGIRNLNVVPEVVYSDKVFTVDLKRPAAGTLKYGVTFDEKSQYFKEITYKNVDETIKDITEIISSLPTKPTKTAEPSGKKSQEPPPDTTKKNASLEEISRTIAWKRFDIQAPDLENQIAIFVNEHLGDCGNSTISPSDTYFLQNSQTASPNPVQVKLSDRKSISPKNTTR